MQRNRTRHSGAVEAPGILDPNQIAVLEALLAGRSITEAAAAVGVSRTTVHRWLKDDFVFQAEINAARRALRQTSLARLDVLCERSIEVLRLALDQASDARIALEVLKGAGILGGDSSVGSPHAELLEAEATVDKGGSLAHLATQSLFL